jgi:hypothetical protein
MPVPVRAQRLFARAERTAVLEECGRAALAASGEGR